MRNLYKMNRLIKMFSSCLLIILAISCTTSKTTVSNHVDLRKYEYASVINNDTYHIPAQLMEYEIQLFDAVEKSNLKLIGDSRIFELTPTQQDKLLLVKYAVDVQQEETIVIVNFIDFATGRPVASCRGAYSSMGVAGASHDIKGAIKRVAKQISKTFSLK